MENAKYLQTQSLTDPTSAHIFQLTISESKGLWVIQFFVFSK